MHCPYCSFEYTAEDPCFCFASLADESIRIEFARILPEKFGPLAIEIPATGEGLIAGSDVLMDCFAGLA